MMVDYKIIRSNSTGKYRIIISKNGAIYLANELPYPEEYSTERDAKNAVIAITRALESRNNSTL